MSSEAPFLVVLEDSPGRVRRMREAFPAARFQVFARAPDLLAWLPGHRSEVDLLSLDYHLASRADGRGLDVARALGGESPRFPVVCHTSDTVGARAMADLMEPAGWTVERVVFESGAWAEVVRRLLQSP